MLQAGMAQRSQPPRSWGEAVRQAAREGSRWSLVAGVLLPESLRLLCRRRLLRRHRLRRRRLVLLLRLLLLRLLLLLQELVLLQEKLVVVVQRARRRLGVRRGRRHEGGRAKHPVKRRAVKRRAAAV